MIFFYVLSLDFYRNVMFMCLSFVCCRTELLTRSGDVMWRVFSTVFEAFQNPELSFL
jgi:hypothetical protein